MHLGWKAAASGLASFLWLGCTTGPMHIKQTHYLAVPSGENTNYYRVRVSADTYLGDAEFRSGWFPSDAVDSLFGDVSSEGSTRALKVREDIRAEIDRAILATTKAYLVEAAKPDADPERLRQLLETRKRVRAAPGDSTPIPESAVEMEYDPTSGLVLSHVGDKLVFVLSSDPDEVIGIIANFAEHQKTSVSVTRLGEVIGMQSANEVAETEAENAANAEDNQALAEQLERALGVAANGGDRDAMLDEIQTLRFLIESLQ